MYGVRFTFLILKYPSAPNVNFMSFLRYFVKDETIFLSNLIINVHVLFQYKKYKYFLNAI